MSHIISEELGNDAENGTQLMDESEARDFKCTQSQVLVKTTIRLKRADHARIKKISEFRDISFTEYVEEALAALLEGDIDNTEYLGERVSEYLKQIKDM